MAQTIKIKRSTSTAAPSTLANAELAYSTSSGKLFIGRPGGATSDVDAIGGKLYTDKLDGIAAGANNYVLPEATSTTKGGIELFSDTDQSVASNAVTTTASRTYGVQLNSSGQGVVNVPWDISSSLPLSGGTMTGDIDFGDNNKATFGASEDLKIYHDSTVGNNKSYIKENGTGNLDIMGSNLTLADSQGDFYLNATENGVVQLYCDNVEKLRTISTGVYVYGLLEADNIETKGYLRGPASFTIDPATHGGNTGTVNIAGNLNVLGTTTTIDSVTLEIEDPHILLNKGQTGTPPSNLVSGFIVDRGSSTDLDMVWLESGSGGWFAMNPNGTRYQLVDSNNFETLYTTLDGGSF